MKKVKDKENTLNLFKKNKPYDIKIIKGKLKKKRITLSLHFMIDC